MHDLDLALWIADSPVKNSYCISGNYSDINLEAPDMAEFILEFEKPCAASVHLDFFHRPRRRQFNIIGTEGCIELEFAQWEQCTIKLYDAKEKSWFTEHLETRRNDMFKAEDKEFLQTISKELPVKCSISEGRKSLELVSPALAKIPKHSLIY
jgi:predicted dehydrogenase